MALYLVGILFLAGLGLVWWTGHQRTHDEHAELKRAPGFEVQLQSGDSLTLAQLQGEVVMVHFWATWCAPCLDEAPELDKLARDFPELKLIAISVDESWKPVKAFLGAKQPAYTVALDSASLVPKRYGTYKYPETYLVSRDGYILERFVGPQRWSQPQLRALVASTLRDAG